MGRQSRTLIIARRGFRSSITDSARLYHAPAEMRAAAATKKRHQTDAGLSPARAVTLALVCAALASCGTQSRADETSSQQAVRHPARGHLPRPNAESSSQRSMNTATATSPSTGTATPPSPASTSTPTPTPRPTVAADATSLKAVASAWDHLTSSSNAGRGDLDEAWTLVDPTCRAKSIYETDLKIHERALAAVKKYMATATAAQQAAEERVLKIAAHDEPKMVVYDGQEGGRTPIDSTPDHEATGAAVFSYEGTQTASIDRFIKRNGRWWVDLRTGPTASGDVSLFGRRFQCPS
jgi:hypothetical protein